MRAVSSRSALSATAARALFVALLGSVSFLTGWAVVAAAPTGTTAGVEGATVSRLTAGVGWATSVAGSGVSALNTNARVRPAALLDDRADDAGGPAVADPWAVLAAVVAVAGLALGALSGSAPSRFSARRARDSRRDRAPPARRMPAYA